MIKLFKVAMADSVPEAVSKTLMSGNITQGAKVEEFEQELAKIFELGNMVTVNSCTSAIHLALAVLKETHNLDHKTEVLTTPLTCAATNMPIVQNGFKIKWCDINPNTLNIDLWDVENKLTERTRILMVVDWGGYPMDYDNLFALKLKYRRKFNEELYIIEDAAHAFGSKWNDLMVGTHPDIFTCFSFQAIKHLTTGDGGLLVPPDKYLKKCRLMRWFGLDRDNKVDFRCCQDITHAGFKFHMNDIQATIGLENLKIVFDNINRQRHNSQFLNKHIRNNFVVKVGNNHFDVNDVDSSCWLHTLIIENATHFINYLKDKGIEGNPVHTRNDRFSCFTKYQTNSLQSLNTITNGWACIPNGWWLTNQDLEHIVETINEYKYNP